MTVDLSFIPHGSRIAVLGQGYVGGGVVRVLRNAEQELGLSVFPLTRHTWRDAIAAQEFDYFINAAGFSGDFRSNPVPTVESNISVAVDILKTARITKGYLAVSSTRVYGFESTPTTPATEDQPLPGLNPTAIDTIYDGSKILAESLTIFGCAARGIKPVVARLSNIYGGYGSPDALDDGTLIKKLVRLSLAGESCTVGQNPLSSKDYIHADDAAEGLLRAVVLSPKGGLYNIASGVSFSLQEVADLLAVPLHTPDKPGNPTHRAISTAKAKEELAFHPRLGLKDGLMLTKNELTKQG